MASETVLRAALDRVALENGFQSGKFNVTFKGEHEYLHTSAVKRYEIHGLPNRPLKLAVTLPPTEIDQFLMVPLANWFSNNVHFYKNVYTRYKSYGGTVTVPKYYGSSLIKNEEYLILEDLESSGYNRPSTTIGLDRTQMILALKTLSLFHQTIEIWKNRNKIEFRRVCAEFKPTISPKYPHGERLSDYEKFERIILQTAWHTSKDGPLASEMRKCIISLLDGCPKRLLLSLEDTHDTSWATLANCTFWTPNLLFRNHTVTGTPVDMAVDEWGACRIGSPALDLSLLIYSSPATALLPEINTILTEHYNGHMTTVEFAKHFPRYGIYGVYGALFVNMVSAIERSAQLDQITVHKLIDIRFKSDDIPDFRERLVAIIKAASTSGII